MKDLELTRTLGALRTVLSTVAAGNGFQFSAAVVSNVLVSLLPAALAYTSRAVIDALVGRHATAPASAGLPWAVTLAGVYVGLLVAQQVGQHALLLANETLTEAGARNIHVAVISAGARLEGLQHFEDPTFHNRRLLLENNALYLPMNCLRFASDLLGVGIAILAMATVLFSVHVAIPILMVVASIPEVLSQIKAHQLRYEGIKETANEERQKDYYRSVLIEPAHAKDVRVYDLKDYFLRRYVATVQRMLDIVLPIRERQLTRALLSRLVASCGTIVPYLWVVMAAGRGRVTPGQLVMCMAAITVIHQQLLRAAQSIAAHQEVMTVAREFAAWTGMKADDVVPERTNPVRRPHHAPPAVRVDRVWFRYPGTAADALQGVELEIAAGQSLAIVGRNGSGKSTLVKLLCRLYDPQQGRITYDQVDVRDLAIEDVRRSTAVIFQDFVRYQLPACQNIALREVDADMSGNGVARAAIMAGADEMIRQLPQQYRTQLGRDFGESVSVELSGGQWQRIALSRAFYRNAGMLIMDEPTASLDIATEAKIYAHFKQMTEGRTALLISHRLATVRLADRIAVMHDGRVVEFGDHESLMARGGLYHDMFTIQAERYRPGTGQVA